MANTMQFMMTSGYYADHRATHCLSDRSLRRNSCGAPFSSRQPGLIVWFWLLVMGCAASVPGIEGSNVVVVTERDANREVMLTTGATLIVRLGAQLGTGYGWQIAENDASVLKPAGPPELEGSGDKPGATQQQIFRFTAEKPGTTRLAFRYVRPWEQEERPARTFRADVRIR